MTSSSVFMTTAYMNFSVIWIIKWNLIALQQCHGKYLALLWFWIYDMYTSFRFIENSFLSKIVHIKYYILSKWNEIMKYERNICCKSKFCSVQILISHYRIAYRSNEVCNVILIDLLFFLEVKNWHEIGTFNIEWWCWSLRFLCNFDQDWRWVSSFQLWKRG